MPAAIDADPTAKPGEELLWQALKEHIMLERQKKKEEQAAEVEEERLRKEKEARDRQDAMTLGETREQIQLLNTRLEELRNEKQQLFLRLKKVLNEDENRKRQQQQKDSEMFALQNIVQQQGQHSQIFLPPRAPHQQLMQKYLQGQSVVPMTGNMPAAQPPVKRTRSPSPTQCYYKTTNPSFSQGATPKHEDGRRSGEVGRAVLWNKPAYQNPAGTLYYPSNVPPDNRGQPIIYPSYPPHLNQPLRPNYHVELSQQQQQQQQQPSSSSQMQHMKVESKSSQQQQVAAQVYHINLDQQQQNQMVQQQQQHMSKQQQQHQQQQHTQHKGHIQSQQMIIDKPPDRGYHLEIKHDDRKDRVQQQQQQQQQQQLQQSQQQHVVQQSQHPQPMTGHLPEGIVYASLRPGMPPQPMHSSVASFQQPPSSGFTQNMKPGGSITQGYVNHGPPPQPPGQQQQRHRYYN